MNYLGIDYGSKRIGLAIGNDEQKIAMPMLTLENDSDLLINLKAIALKEHIGGVVVGVPVSFDGKEYTQAERARTFGESLKELNFPIHFENEMLTSKQSRDSGSTDVDASSAALILQGFLDRRLKD